MPKGPWSEGEKPDPKRWTPSPNVAPNTHMEEDSLGGYVEVGDYFDALSEAQAALGEARINETWMKAAAEGERKQHRAALARAEAAEQALDRVREWAEREKVATSRPVHLDELLSLLPNPPVPPEAK